MTKLKTIHSITKGYTPRGNPKTITLIQCSECGCLTKTSEPSRVQQCLERSCSYCRRLQYGQLRGGLHYVWEQIQQEQLLKIDPAYYPPEGVGNITHGNAHTYAYKTWQTMMQRCFNTNDPNYSAYGGRGITVCPRWSDFNLFFEDMGERPEGYEIDRIDNDGPYAKGNCRWVPHQVNVDNRRSVFKTYSTGNWWRENFGLKTNPYIYGPMPWKKTALVHRKNEAVERGWYVPRSERRSDEF